MSEDRQTIKITVFDIDSPELGSEWPAGNFAEFVSWQEYLLRTIPEQYRESAQVKFGPDRDIGYPNLQMEVFYFRPETDAEMAERVRKDRLRHENVGSQFE